MTTLAKYLCQMLEDKTFKEQMVLKVLDKLFLGIAIVLVGIYLDCKLNDYQSRKAYELAVAVKRINTVGELWPCLKSYETMCGQALLAYDSICARHYSSSGELYNAIVTEYNPKTEMIKQQGVEVFKQIDKHRFWLANNMYEEFNSLALDWGKLVAANSNNQKEDVIKLKKSIAKHCEHIDEWKHKFGMPSSVRSASWIK